MTSINEQFDHGLRGHDLWQLVRKQIDAEPHLWNQRQWGSRPLSLDAFRAEVAPGSHVKEIIEPCDTAHCAAGWACALSGQPMVFLVGAQTSSTLVSGGASVMETATDLFGVTEHQARGLFNSENTLADLDEIAADIWPEHANDNGENG